MRRGVVGLALLLSVGCRKESEAPTEEAASATPAVATVQASSEASADTASLLARVGSGSPVAFVVRLEHWDAVRGALEAVVGGDASPPLSAVLDASDSEALLAWAGSQLGVDTTKLVGVDPRRPIVGALGEPPDLDPLAVPSLSDAGLPRSLGLRSVAFVPVTDAKAFIASLPAALGPKFETVGSWGGEGSWTGRVAEADYVVADAEGDYVRLTVFTGVFGVAPEEAKGLLSPRLQPPRAAPVSTPALQAVLAGDSALSVHVRPWRLRSLFSHVGYSSMLRAAATVDPQMRATVTAMGLSVVLRAETLMTDGGAEIDDWGWTLRTRDEQIGIGAVASLTPTGRKLFDAARTDVAALKLAEAPAVAGGFVRLDVERALAAVELPERLSGRSGDALAQMFLECGVGCSMHTAMRTPMRGAKLAVQAMAGPDADAPSIHV